MNATTGGPAGWGVVRLPSQRTKDQHIAALVAEWEREGKETRPREESLPFITLSRQFGCMGWEIGLRLCERLNRRSPSSPRWICYDRQIVKWIAEDLHVSQRLVNLLTERSRRRITEYLDTHFQSRPTGDEVFRRTARVIRGVCEKGHAVVVGRGACRLAGDSQGGVHLRVVAPFTWRVEQVQAVHGISREEAEQRTRLMDEERNEFFRRFFRHDITDADLYDLVLNQARLHPDLIVDLVVAAMEGRGLLPRPA